MEPYQSKKEKRYNIGYFMMTTLTSLAIFVISFFVLFFMEKQVRSIQFAELKEQEARLTSIENAFIDREFGMVLSDLYYLKYAQDSVLLKTDNYNEIASNWSEFSTHRQIYDQMSFVDFNGDEKIRVSFIGNKGQVAPSSQLENKKRNNNFYESLELKDGSVHISALDLNIEHGQLEMPHKPILKFSTPIYDRNGRVKGVIILNYLAEEVLSNFKNLAENSAGELVLLNSDSFWLTNESQDSEWNFMFGERKKNNFKAMFPNEWEQVTRGDGQIITPNGLFTFETVDLKMKMEAHRHTQDVGKLIYSGGKWYIVSTVVRTGKLSSYFLDQPSQLVWDVLRTNSFYFLLVFFASLFVAFVIQVNRKTYARIKYYSEYDGLTGVYNRRAGIARLDEMIPNDDRRRCMVSLCFIDVNGLKQVNDILGHRLGDELIKTVVDVVQDVIRDQDFIIRMGGDEFLIVLTGVEIEDAEKIWKRVCLEYERINEMEERPYIISVSHGIVNYSEHHTSQLEDMIKLADEKMYHEKSVIKVNLKVLK